MNPIDEGILSRGLSYAEYRARVKRNAEVFDEVYAEPGFDAADLEFFRRLPALTVVAIGEDWCPDVFHTLPTWARLTEELDGWSLSIFERDSDPPLIESFLYRGSSKRIPVYAFFDARRYLRTWWSGRSAIAERAVRGWLAGRTYAELDDAGRRELGRRFEEGYRGEFRRANFVEIRTQLGAFFHLAAGPAAGAGNRGVERPG